MSKIYLRSYINLRFFTRLLLALTVFSALIFLYFYLTGTARTRFKDWLGLPGTVKDQNAVLDDKKARREARTDFLVDASQFDYLPMITASVGDFIQTHSIFRQTAAGLFLPVGQYVFTEPVIVPRGTQLTIAPGTAIEFRGESLLLSYSPIVARGTAEQPISFKSDNDAVGGNVVVVDTGEVSIFEHTRWQGAGEGSLNRIFFSGMLALQHASGIIRYSTFENARGDDALNIKYASSTVAFNLFQNNRADAIDYDYSTGVIERNRFIDNGNDGIDTSGSPVRIANNEIIGSGDKCISIGEVSAPVIIDNLLDHCRIGIEIKDLSTPAIINNVITNNKIGINAYQKKEFFGGGHAQISSSTIQDNGQAIVTDSVSTVQVF